MLMGKLFVSVSNYRYRLLASIMGTGIVQIEFLKVICFHKGSGESIACNLSKGHND